MLSSERESKESLPDFFADGGAAFSRIFRTNAAQAATSGVGYAAETNIYSSRAKQHKHKKEL